MFPNKYFTFFQRSRGVIFLICSTTVYYKYSMFLQACFNFQISVCLFFVFSVFATMSLHLALSLFVYSSETPGDFQRHCMFHRFFETVEVKHV